MNTCVFRLYGGKATLILSDDLPSDEWRIETLPRGAGTLLLSGKRIPITEDGARIRANELHSGVHTPSFLVGGERCEGGRIAVFGGVIYPLPPTRAELSELFAQCDAQKEELAALEIRLSRLEGLLQTTNIF